MQDALSHPAFYFTYAVIQAALLLFLIRYLDFYDRQPLSAVALVAAWGATGAAAISLVGNQIVAGLLSGDVRIVFGQAIAPPVVEEAAKGLALLAAVGPVRFLARRAGVTLFEGVGAGVVYGAAVGLGFAFTEDIFYLVERARTEGLDAGFDIFLHRRDFFGPAIIHHAAFTGAFGAALGLAAWRRRGALKVLYPLLGFLLAVLLHAANNGLVQAVLVLRFGVDAAADWVQGMPPTLEVAATASTVTRLMRIVDFYYLAVFIGVMVLWARHERRLVLEELEEELESGLINRLEWEILFGQSRWLPHAWTLVRSGQLERWRHLRRLRVELARLALLKWRTRRFGGDWGRVQRARRQIATLATYDTAPVEVPLAANALIGRADVLSDLQQLLARPEVRLVTLTGPGGTGKTRLAMELASQERHRFSSGVFFVELAAVTDAELLPASVADVLELREVAGESILDRLKGYLRDKQLLLVLDNLEQLAEAAPTIAELLAATQRLTIVTTSRQPLRIRGEHSFPVPPLELPRLEAAADGAGSFSDNAAVTLFVERARAANPDFELTDDNARSIAEICVKLDGLPLAIELAAARTNLLSPQDMLQRLESRLQLLSGGDRDLPSRHQTLSDTIAWSYDLLDPTEQILFARLAVFVDGATVQAAEAVCGEPATVDLLSSLLDKSLLRRQTAPDGQLRFSMLQTVRDYALERLTERGELAEMRRRHAAYHVSLAEIAEPELAGPEQDVWVRRLEQEVANVRAVLSWSRESGELEPGLRIAAALPRFWSMRGLNEGHDWLGEALALNPDIAPAVEAKALYAYAYGSIDRRDSDVPLRYFEAALTRYRELGDERGTAACLVQLGWLVTAEEPERFERLTREGLELASRIGDDHIRSTAIATLADGALEGGDVARARSLHRESLDLRRRVGDHRNIANSLLRLGHIELVEGDLVEAKSLLEEALGLARRVRDMWSLSVGLAGLGRVALLEGKREEALALLAVALELSRQRGAKGTVSDCLDALAQAAAAGDELPRAARLSGSADAMRRSIGRVLSPAERSWRESYLADLRRELGEEGFQRHWEVGERDGFDEAVSFALSSKSLRPLVQASG